MKVGARRFATIIAALRHYQEDLSSGEINFEDVNHPLYWIASDMGRFTPLGPDKIETMIKELQAEP